MLGGCSLVHVLGWRQGVVLMLGGSCMGAGAVSRNGAGAGVYFGLVWCWGGDK